MIDFSPLYEEIDKRVQFFDEEEEAVLAQVLKTRIVNRTLNGSDINGVEFQPYVPSYEKYGRANKGLQLTPVDLYALGNPHLLDSITRMDDHTLFFLAELVPIAQGLQAKREFFGANDSDWQAGAEACVIKFNERF